MSDDEPDRREEPGHVPHDMRLNDDVADTFDPDWDFVTPPDVEYKRIGHALRKICEIDGIGTTTSAEVELQSGDRTEATIGIVVTDAVIDDE